MTSSFDWIYLRSSNDVVGFQNPLKNFIFFNQLLIDFKTSSKTYWAVLNEQVHAGDIEFNT